MKSMLIVRKSLVEYREQALNHPKLYTDAQRLLRPDQMIPY